MSDPANDPALGPDPVTDALPSPQTPAVLPSLAVDTPPPPPFVPPPPTFDAVYQGQLSYVWRTLWRLGVRERDLEDAAHDVFVVVHRKLSTYDPSRPLKPWLFGICFRTALDRRRKASTSREVPSPDHAIDVDDEAPSAHDRAEDNQRRALVHRALCALPLEQRAVFVLHELDGVGVPDCVPLLDAPLNTLYSRLRLARKAFARLVTEAQQAGALP